ncbi:MAG: hypothetical protein ACRD0A_04115 [Acidimicrobiales bacterium]
MSDLDAATVLLQWATGGLLFLWVTTRRRLVGVGYGWLVRGVYGTMAVGAVLLGFRFDPVPAREGAAIGVVLATALALVVSIVRRRAGVSGERAERERRAARVAAMTGARPSAPSTPPDEATGPDDRGPEFPPALDLVAPIVGMIGLIAAGWVAGGDDQVLNVARILAGAALMGSVTDAMLVGHWYLVQPGLPRTPIVELIRWAGAIWPIEVALLLVPPGMVSVLNGSIDDGYNGLLGWFWVACAATTGVLLLVARAALRERAYSAVMATTGLLYLAILTAFGTDLVARAVLAG